MPIIKFLFFITVILLSSQNAAALTYEDGADAPTRSIEDYIEDYVDIPKGAVDWKVFGKTKQIEVIGKTEDGFDLQYFKPEFPPEVKSLEGKEITIKGFMFPLEESEKQKTFLFGPFPMNCPFQYHVGPTLVIEVHTNGKPVEFSYDPIIMKGILELVSEDTDNSTFFRLRNARQTH